jgi:hypothetical protein
MTNIQSTTKKLPPQKNLLTPHPAPYEQPQSPTHPPKTNPQNQPQKITSKNPKTLPTPQLLLHIPLPIPLPIRVHIHLIRCLNILYIIKLLKRLTINTEIDPKTLTHIHLIATDLLTIIIIFIHRLPWVILIAIITMDIFFNINW